MKKKLLILLIHFLFFYELDAQQFEWARQFGRTDGWSGHPSVALDASGNIYTSGNFAVTADFDPGLGVFNLTSAGSWDAYITKLDSSGNLIWAKRMGGPEYDKVVSIFVDSIGDVYTTGEFGGTADFNPGSGTFNTFNLTAAGGKDCFISKLDASGKFLWAKRIGGTRDESGYSISVDASGNVCICGRFSGTVDFDPGIGIFNLGGYDNFILKLDASGNFIWVKQFGGAQNDVPLAIVNDASGNIYTTGFFNGTADFDPGIDTFKFTSVGGNDIFISKLDATGNFVWAIQLAGSYNDDFGYSIKSDHKGNIYIVGSFTGAADFDPGTGKFNLNANGGLDVFVLKLEESGDFVWAKNFGGANNLACGIAIDLFGNVYTTGSFQASGDFDPGPGTFNLSTSIGMDDIFISKLDASGNFVWARQMGGTPGFDRGISLVVDTFGNVYSTGFFFTMADFDPGPGIFNLTGNSFQNYLHKMSQCQAIGTDVRTECDSLKWIDGKTYTSSNKTASHILKNSKDCDSLVLLDLQINQSVFKTVAKTACDSFNWNGKIYEQSGDYLFRYQVSTGCDSNVTLNLKINRSNDTTLHRTACKLFGFNDQVYTTGGKYFIKLKNHQGCDSLIELNLNIVTLDTSITRLGNTLFAIDSTASYQWVDCDDNFAIIPGATQKTFTPVKDGGYAVILNAPPCMDTSACTPVVLTNTVNSNKRAGILFPNPASDRIFLEIPTLLDKESTVVIRDINGRNVFKKQLIGMGKSILDIDISNFQAGVYYISIISATSNTLISFSKQ